jgi:hypothetical protein
MRLHRLIGLGLLAAVLMGCNLPDAAAKREATSSPTATASEVAFVLRAHSPSYLPAFTQPDAGCNWVGVAGQVLDNQSKPVDHVAVVVKGKFNGKDVNQAGNSGTATAYGPGGFEVLIGEQSEDTLGNLTIQLFDDKNKPLSDIYPIVTYQDCQKNLIVYTFQASKASQNEIFVPFVIH